MFYSSMISNDADRLERLTAVIDFEVFGADLDAALDAPIGRRAAAL